VRPQDRNRKLFHRGHYEIIAARFRESLEPLFRAQETAIEELNDANIIEPYRTSFEKLIRLPATAATGVAISLAKRFALDNEGFDPVMFLDRCSPDPEKYPLSELWEGVNEMEAVD
jgi:hypothetical protein